MLDIYVDNEFSFTIDESDFISMGLYDEPEITKERLSYITNELLFRKAKNIAVKYLSIKMRTQIEVRNKIILEGYGEVIAARVIDELKSIGYINDTLYIQKYIFDRSKLKPMAKKLLRYELGAKGISNEDIDTVLSDWEIDEVQIAADLVGKKFAKYDLNDPKNYKKVLSFLMNRGFSLETSKYVVKNYQITIE